MGNQLFIHRVAATNKQASYAANVHGFVADEHIMYLENFRVGN